MTHISYIAAAFGFSTFILVLNLWWPLRQKRKLYQNSDESTSSI